MQMAVTTADAAADAPVSRRSRRSGSSIPCFDYFVHRSGTIDASTIRGKSPGMIQTIANRAWAGLSLQKQQGIMEQAREEELCCPSQTGPDPAQDVPISQIQIARRNLSSNNVDASPEPMVEDNADIAARPGDDNVEAGGIDESMVVDESGNNEESGNPANIGISATGTANSGGLTEDNLDVLLVEAEAQYKAAEEALKGLRDTLKREKRKDEKAMADAEKKRNKMKEAMRHLEQRVQMREHLRSQCSAAKPSSSLCSRRCFNTRGDVRSDDAGRTPWLSSSSSMSLFSPYRGSSGVSLEVSFSWREGLNAVASARFGGRGGLKMCPFGVSMSMEAS